MSHARNGRHVLRFYATGGVELLSSGTTVWASDADPDFTEEFGLDVLADQLPPEPEPDHESDPDTDDEDWDDTVDAVLDYLIDAGYLTEAQADHCLVRYPLEEKTS